MSEKEDKKVEEKKHAVDIARHALYMMLKKAGLLVNGHIKLGSHFIPDKKKQKNKKECRNKDWD